MIENGLMNHGAISLTLLGRECSLWTAKPCLLLGSLELVFGAR